MDRSSVEPSPSQPSSPNPYTSTPNKFKNASSTESAQVPQSVIDRVQCNNETQRETLGFLFSNVLHFVIPTAQEKMPGGKGGET